MGTTYEIGLTVDSPEVVSRLDDIERQLERRLSPRQFLIGNRWPTPSGRGARVSVAVHVEADDASLAVHRARDLIVQACQSAGVDVVGPDVAVVVRPGD